MQKTTSKKKHYTKAPVVNLHATFGINNTIVTATDAGGIHKLFQLSPPRLGFRGPKKPTPYAAFKTMEEVMKRLQENHKTTTIKTLFVSGPGSGRDVALRAIKIQVQELIDVTPVVYNGCRPKGAKSL